MTPRRERDVIARTIDKPNAPPPGGETQPDGYWQWVPRKTGADSAGHKRASRRRAFPEYAAKSLVGRILTELRPWQLSEYPPLGLYLAWVLGTGRSRAQCMAYGRQHITRPIAAKAALFLREKAGSLLALAREFEVISRQERWASKADRSGLRQSRRARLDALKGQVLPEGARAIGSGRLGVVEVEMADGRKTRRVVEGGAGLDESEGTRAELTGGLGVSVKPPLLSP